MPVRPPSAPTTPSVYALVRILASAGVERATQAQTSDPVGDSPLAASSSRSEGSGAIMPTARRAIATMPAMPARRERGAPTPPRVQHRPREHGERTEPGQHKEHREVASVQARPDPGIIPGEQAGVEE